MRALILLVAGGLVAAAIIYLPPLYWKWRFWRQKRRNQRLLRTAKELEAANGEMADQLQAALRADDEGQTILTASQRELIETTLRRVKEIKNK